MNVMENGQKQKESMMFGQDINGLPMKKRRKLIEQKNSDVVVKVYNSAKTRQMTTDRTNKPWPGNKFELGNKC